MQKPTKIHLKSLWNSTTITALPSQSTQFITTLSPNGSFQKQSLQLPLAIDDFGLAYLENTKLPFQVDFYCLHAEMAINCTVYTDCRFTVFYALEA